MESPDKSNVDIVNLSKMFSLGPRIVKQLLHENNGNIENTIDSILILTNDPLSVISSRVPSLKLKEDEQQIAILEHETLAKQKNQNVLQQPVNNITISSAVKSAEEPEPKFEPIVILSDYPLKPAIPIKQQPIEVIQIPLKPQPFEPQMDLGSKTTVEIEMVPPEPFLEKSVDLLADFVQISVSHHPLFTIFTPKTPTDKQSIEISLIESLLVKLNVSPKDIIKIPQDDNDINSIRQLTEQEPQLPVVFLRRRQLGVFSDLARLLQTGTLKKADRTRRLST